MSRRQFSEDSKALLFWREEGDEKSFSDWRIKVESGYFKALLQSDSFSENTDGMSTVKLPADIAQHFPDFLDYLYAQPVETSSSSSLRIGSR